jgi:hypothetical protein
VTGPGLRDVPLFSAGEAEAIVRRLDARPAAWEHRAAVTRLYTLGTPSYLELPTAEYEASAARSNAVLRAEFAEVHARVFAALAPLLAAVHDGPLAFADHHALPGFQIAIIDEVARGGIGGVGGAHWDWSFLHLRWDPALPAAVPIDRFASFTVPLALPAAGGGLLVWDSITSGEVTRHAIAHRVRLADAAAALTRRLEPRRHAYRVGSMCVHSGQLVHRAAPWSQHAGDRRITLQGHALFDRGRWHVYW